MCFVVYVVCVVVCCWAMLLNSFSVSCDRCVVIVRLFDEIEILLV